MPDSSSPWQEYLDEHEQAPQTGPEIWSRLFSPYKLAYGEAKNALGGLAGLAQQAIHPNHQMLLDALVPGWRLMTLSDLAGQVAGDPSSAATDPMAAAASIPAALSPPDDGGPPSSSNIEDRRGTSTWWDRHEPSMEHVFGPMRTLQLMFHSNTPEQQRYLDQNFPQQIPSTPLTD